MREKRGIHRRRALFGLSERGTNMSMERSMRKSVLVGRVSESSHKSE